MDFVPATSKRTPYNFRRSLIPSPKMYNVHYIAKYLQVGWSGRKVEASTPRNMFRPSLLPGSWAPLLLTLQGKRKSSLDMHETFDYCLTSPRPARGHGEKLLRGMFAAASFARAGKMMGARIQHYWGLWSNVWFDQADISGGQSGKGEITKSVMCYIFKHCKFD